MQRTYAASATTLYSGTLGFGWTHNHDTRLIFEPGSVWFKAHTANQYRFIDNGNGTYTPYPGVLATLTSSLSERTLRRAVCSVLNYGHDTPIQNR